MNIKKLIRQSSLPVMSVKAWTILLLTFATTMVMAEVPDSLNVQGRATTPLTTISGTATILPVGVSQLFTADTDENGVFQFALTGITSGAFSDPNTSLRLEIGTTTINIPFTSVPFAFRAATADTLVGGATVQVNIINVTSITATTINVTTITVRNIIASSATVDGSVSVGGGVKIGNSIILGYFDPLDVGADNTIKFEGGGGTIAAAAPGPGPLTLQTQGGFPINLNPGGPGLVSIGGNIELQSNQRLIQAVGGPLRIQLAPGDIYMAEGGGNIGIGVLAPVIPASRLHVVADDPDASFGSGLTSESKGRRLAAFWSLEKLDQTLTPPHQFFAARCSYGLLVCQVQYPEGGYRLGLPE